MRRADVHRWTVLAPLVALALGARPVAAQAASAPAGDSACAGAEQAQADLRRLRAENDSLRALLAARTSRRAARTTRSAPKVRAAAAPVAPVYAPAPERVDAAPRPLSGGRAGTFIRGPRGGCYTYSPSGRKVYVERSLCS